MGGRTHGLRVDDAGARLRVPSGVLAEQAAKPVVQLAEQALDPPAPVEGVDAVPCGEVHRHGPPLAAVVVQVAHRVDHLPVTVALRLPAPPLQPAGHRHRVAHDGPLLARHVRGVHRPPIRTVDRIPEPVSEAVTRRGRPVGRDRRRDGRLRHQGLLGVRGFNNSALPRRPYLHARAHRQSSNRGGPLELTLTTIDSATAS